MEGRRLKLRSLENTAAKIDALRSSDPFDKSDLQQHTSFDEQYVSLAPQTSNGTV